LYENDKICAISKTICVEKLTIFLAEISSRLFLEKFSFRPGTFLAALAGCRDRVHKEFFSENKCLSF